MPALRYIRDSTITSTLEYHTIIMELRTDIYYEYSAAFKSVRIYQIFENSPTVSELVLVANERADSEEHADKVVMQFRMTHTDEVLPAMEIDE